MTAGQLKAGRDLGRFCRTHPFDRDQGVQIQKVRIAGDYPGNVRGDREYVSFRCASTENCRDQFNI